MLKNSLVLDDKFWEILKYVDSLDHGLKLSQIIDDLDVSEDDLVRSIYFLNELNYKIKLNVENDEKFLSPPLDKSKIHFDMSFAEWLSFQVHFPKIAEEKNKAFHKTLSDKLVDVENEYPQFDLFKLLEDEEMKQKQIENMYEENYELIQTIESSIDSNVTITVKIQDGKKYDIFTHKLVYLDGALSIVGEDCSDRCLVYFKVTDIENIKSYLSKSYNANFSTIEVNDFILAIRAVTGKEERLILKIKNPESLELRPPYHFLGNPYVTSNVSGDLIWAASVETCNELFEWLCEIKDHVEIMDPIHLKNEYLNFIDRKNKLKNAA